MMASWLLLVLALITFANRFAFLNHAFRYTPGEKIRQFLSYSSFAVLTAIWVPIVFQLEVSRGVSIAGLDYLIAGLIAAFLTILKVRSIFVVLLSTGAFFLLRFVLLN